jgi:hypothetical protein
MGTEFIANQRKSAKKYLDRRKAELCASTLFKSDPETLDRQFLAKAEGVAHLHPGDPLQIESQGAGLILKRAGCIVGRTDSPHPGLQRAISEAGGFFPGEVRSVHTLSPTFEFCIGAGAPGSRAHA